MHGDGYHTDDTATAPDPAVAVRLEAATTLIGDDEPDAPIGRDGTTLPDGGASAPSPAPPKPPPLRVVLAFRPRPSEVGVAPTYDVTVSADRGKDAACDPYWQSFENLDLHSALDEAAGVVAAAEEQWLSEPLYPRVTPQPGKAATKPATGGKSKPAPAKQPPAAPTAILPALAPAAPAPPAPAPRQEPHTPTTAPAPRVAETATKDAEPAGGDQPVATAVGGPLLPLGKPPTSAKKAGDRKQLSLFG